MTIEKMTLTGLDWIIIILYGIGMLAVGFYYSRKNKSADDYMLGGRGMKSWAVGISLFATMFSAISYLSTPGEMIKHGPMFFLMLAAMPFIYFIAAYFFIPFIMKLKITSAYELLETKLGLHTRILASSYFLIMRFLWMAVVIYMVAQKVIVPIMGWSEQGALMVSVVIGLITVIYTSIGGLRGVIVTDVAQSFILFGGTFLAIFIIINELGSVSAIIPTEWPNHWDGWAFFDANARISFVTLFVSTLGWYVCTAGSDQMSIQRFLATKDVKAARKMYLSNLLIGIFVTVLLAVMGLALLAYTKINPVLLEAGVSVSEGADTLFPRFIAIGLPSGLSGIVLAGLLAAAMSSLSSGINSSSLSIVNDFILRLGNKTMSETKKVKLATIISFFIGIVIILLSLVMGNVKGNLLELTYKTVNLLVAPLFVPFFMAMFIRFAKPNATFIGTLSSGIAAIMISFSQELFSISISFLWIIPGSFIVGIVLSILLSYLPIEKTNEVN